MTAKGEKQKKTKQKRESDILRECCEWLQLQNIFFWRSNNMPVFGRNNAGEMTFRSMPRFALKGVPDIIAIQDGQFIGLEIKRPKAAMRPEQVSFMLRCQQNKAQYHVVNDVSQLWEIFGEEIILTE